MHAFLAFATQIYRYFLLVQRGPLGPVLVQRNGTTHFNGPSKGYWALPQCTGNGTTCPKGPTPLSTGGVHGLACSRWAMPMLGWPAVLEQSLK